LVHSFQLDGKHATTACFTCHQGASPIFEGTSKECLGCHQKDQQTANLQIPNHRTFPSQCGTCHSTTSWKPTLPHEAPTQPTEPHTAAAAEALGSTSRNAKPGMPAASQKTKAGTTPSWPVKNQGNPAAPDQISGASRVKKH
jgi:hypothetical protein